MGTASKVASLLFRIGELICAAVVVGILGHYLSVIDDANVNADSRIVYGLSIGAISLFLSLVFMPPLKYSFWSFPIDYALFICWMVAFGLQVDLTGSRWCDSYWYWHTWGYYWGGWWRTVPITSATQSIVGTAACSSWRANIAFNFIGGWLWFGSGLIGTYVIVSSRRERHNQAESSIEPSSQPPKSSTENSVSV